jgi:hypothetical protein
LKKINTPKSRDFGVKDFENKFLEIFFLKETPWTRFMDSDQTHGAGSRGLQNCIRPKLIKT